MQVIEGDTDVRIGDSNISYDKTFDTSGRLAGGLAVMTVTVSGLTAATDTVAVEINGQLVGRIRPYRYESVSTQLEVAAHHYTQFMNIGPDILNDGNNDLHIEAIGFPEATGTNAFDDFDLRDAFVFYQTEV
jgi:hypothetical protein